MKSNKFIFYYKESFFALRNNKHLYIVCVIIDAKVTGDLVQGDRGMDGDTWGGGIMFTCTLIHFRIVWMQNDDYFL